MTEFLLKRAITLLRWMDEPAGKYFMQGMMLWLGNLRHKMEKEKDPVEIYRYQGRIEVLNRIVGIREELVNSQRHQ